MELKTELDKSDISQNEIARHLGIDRAALSRYANGTRQPGLIDRLKINRYFGKMVLPIEKETVKLCLSIRGLAGKED
jgi:transcriptional regulator with XRE-family HTH domain